MTRALLSVLLCGLTLGLGLESARLQSENYAKGEALDAQKRRCDLIEAGNEGLLFQIEQRLFQIEREEDNTIPTELINNQL
jgi:hypothetical protein